MDNSFFIDYFYNVEKVDHKPSCEAFKLEQNRARTLNETFPPYFPSPSQMEIIFAVLHMD